MTRGARGEVNSNNNDATQETTMTTARDAIRESVIHNEIVHIPYDSDTAYELSILAEDGAEISEGLEYWGTDDSDGSSWRVHLDGAEEALP